MLAVCFSFVGDNEVYKLPLHVLLELESETPLDEVVVEDHIMAPWSDDSSGKVQYVEAIILSSKIEGKEGLIYIFGLLIVKLSKSLYSLKQWPDIPLSL